MICEVKTGHCERAWHQLNRLYLPVLQSLYPRERFRLMEVCQTFYPNVMWPGPMQLVAKVEKTPQGVTGVHVINRYL